MLPQTLPLEADCTGIFLFLQDQDLVLEKIFPVKTTTYNFKVKKNANFFCYSGQKPEKTVTVILFPPYFVLNYYDNDIVAQT